MFVFLFISGCNVLDKEDDFDGITVNTYTSVDDLGENFGLYYGFVIENERNEEYNFSVQFTPEDEELKKIIGTHTVSQNINNKQTTSFVSVPGSKLSIGATIAIPKNQFSKEELEKKIKKFSFSINNGKHIKIYE